MWMRMRLWSRACAPQAWVLNWRVEQRGPLCLDSPSLCFSANATVPSLSILMLAREEGGKRESKVVRGEESERRELADWEVQGWARIQGPRTGMPQVAVAEQERQKPEALKGCSLPGPEVGKFGGRAEAARSLGRQSSPQTTCRALRRAPLAWCAAAWGARREREPLVCGQLALCLAPCRGFWLGCGPRGLPRANGELCCRPPLPGAEHRRLAASATACFQTIQAKNSRCDP